MGLIKRLNRITLARIEAFLASVETPERLLPQIERELADRIGAAVNAEAKALTAVRADRRRLDEAAGRVLRFQQGARLAVDAGDDATAREALAAQLRAEEAVAARQKAQETAESALAEAGRVRRQLQDELARLKEQPPGARELRRAKDYVLGQLRLGLESTSNQMMWIGDNLLAYGRFIPPETAIRQVERVTAGEVRALAGEILRPDRVSLAVLAPDIAEKDAPGVRRLIGAL